MNSVFNQGDLKLLHLNVRSLQSKINQISHLQYQLKTAKHDIDIIIFRETFMNNLNINKCKINEYTSKEYVYRENSKKFFRHILKNLFKSYS